MNVRIQESEFKGLKALTLENDLIRVDIFPDAGAKVYNFIYKPADYNFMWHNPTVEPTASTPGQSYDDNFSGGWDELFPNDAPAVFQGRSLLDHGELWCNAWNHEIVEDGNKQSVLHLSHLGDTSGALVEKWISLEPGSAKLNFRHRISNLGDRPLAFLWKLHPALKVSRHHRVHVPGRRGEYVDAAMSRLDNPRMEFAWPTAVDFEGGQADLGQVLPQNAGKIDFVYVSELKAGWCAVTDTQKKLGFGLVFPRSVFPFVWLFMPAGGWRGIQTVILEPCTACPKNLDLALERGTIAHLDPGQKLECRVTGLAFEVDGTLEAITPEGEVITAEAGRA